MFDDRKFKKYVEGSIGRFLELCATSGQVF